jgi:plasmid maintenance system antidote protein VapI
MADIRKSYKQALLNTDKKAKDVAESMGIKSGALSSMTSNDRNITIKTLTALAAQFDMKPSEFLALGGN